MLINIRNNKIINKSIKYKYAYKLNVHILIFNRNKQINFNKLIIK